MEPLTCCSIRPSLRISCPEFLQNGFSVDFFAAGKRPLDTLRAHLMTQQQPVTKSTKIVATLGPASSSEEVLTQLILEGLNVARINLSGAHEVHGTTIDTVRRIDGELGTYTADQQICRDPNCVSAKLPTAKWPWWRAAH